MRISDWSSDVCSSDLRLAIEIIEALSRPYEVDQHTLYIGASVGSAIAPRDGRTAEMLIRGADLALYRSKEHGGGPHHPYEPKLHVHAEERRVLEIALREALEKNQRSEEHTSELQSLMRISYAVFCLKKKNKKTTKYKQEND